MRKSIQSAILLLFLALFTLAAGEERPPTEAERAAFLKAFEKLSSDSYKERKAAAEEIVALGTPVLGLLDDRKDDPDPEVQEAVGRIMKAIKLDIARRRIVKLIEDTGVDDDPEELLKKYSSSSEKDRTEAFLRLSIRHTPACIPIVKEFLEDPSDKITDMAIAGLRQLLEGKDLDTAWRILEVVGRTPPDQEIVLDRISNFLSFADFRHESLVESLASLADRKVREMVFTRMVLLPEENFIFAFAAMLADEDRFTRRYCAGGIEVIIREILLKDRKEMFSFSEEDSKRLSGLLARYLGSSDPIVVQVVTGAIGRTGMLESADRVIELLGSADLSTARRAAVSLGLARIKKAVPALIGVLRKGNYDMLPECADSLARIGDPAAFEPLFELSKKKEIPFRELLLYAMVRVDLRRSADHLPGFLSDTDVSVRSLAVDRLVQAMKEHPELAASKTPGLLQIIREGDPRAKVASARVLGEVGGISLLPELKKLAASNDPQIRSVVFMPVAMIEQENARDFLTRNAKDPDYQVRVRAAEALGYLGSWTEFLNIRLVPLEVKGDSAVDALRRIAWATGMNLVIDPAAVRMCSLDTCVISFPLKGKTVIDALRILEERFSISWDTGHHVLFVTVKAREDILEKFGVPSAGVGCTDADLDMEKKLDTRLTCDSVSESIDAFFAKVSARTGIAFKLDKSIATRLAEPLQRIDLTASDIPLSELLRLVLAPRGLAARIAGGEILIHPQK